MAPLQMVRERRAEVLVSISLLSRAKMPSRPANFALQQQTGNFLRGKRQWCDQRLRTMTTRFLHKVKHLEALDIDALRALWRQIFRSSPPKSARREFLLRILTHTAQEQSYRTLSKLSTKALRDFEDARRLTEVLPTPPETKLRPGARLVRQWGGKDHEVMVMERGYAYRGTSYSSLSEIARHITGTRWSGPRFFGLKKKASAVGVEERA